MLKALLFAAVMVAQADEAPVGMDPPISYYEDVVCSDTGFDLKVKHEYNGKTVVATCEGMDTVIKVGRVENWKEVVGDAFLLAGITQKYPIAVLGIERVEDCKYVAEMDFALKRHGTPPIIIGLAGKARKLCTFMES